MRRSMVHRRRGRRDQGVRVLPAPSAAVRALGGPNGITVTEHAHSKSVDLWVQSESAELATKALSLNRYLSATLPFERERITYEGKGGISGQKCLTSWTKKPADQNSP